MTPPLRPETLVVHAGHRADATTGAVAMPMCQTPSYPFRDTRPAASRFGLDELGNIYSRIMSRTRAVLAGRWNGLEV